MHLDIKLVITRWLPSVAAMDNDRNTLNDGTSIACDNKIQHVVRHVNYSSHVLDRSISIKLSCEPTGTGIIRVIKMEI